MYCGRVRMKSNEDMRPSSIMGMQRAWAARGCSHVAAGMMSSRCLLPVLACGLLLSSCAGCGVNVECGGVRHVAGPTPVLAATYRSDAPAPDELVVFGDSLSDTGALLSQSLGVAPNPDGYFAGRFSNGPNWVDYVADALGVASDDHAYGGASTHGDPSAIPKPFDAAVSEYLECTPDELASTSVFALWIGHNDYYGGASDPPAIAAATLAAVEALAARGAQRFLIPELLPLTGTPRPVEESESGIDGSTADAHIAAHNEELSAGIEQLRAELHMQIGRARPADMRKRILEQPSLLGIENTSDACFTGDVYWLTGGSGDICDAPDLHFHWDGIHPATRVHCAYAIEMLRALGEVGLLDIPSDDLDQLRRCSAVQGRMQQED